MLGLGVSPVTLAVRKQGAAPPPDTTGPAITDQSWNATTKVWSMTFDEPVLFRLKATSSITSPGLATIYSTFDLEWNFPAGDAEVLFDETAFGPGTWYIHAGAWDAALNGTLATPISFTNAAPMVLSQYREAGGYSSALAVLIGPTTSDSDEIIIVVACGPSQSPAIPNFDQIGGFLDGGQRYAAFRWNKTGARPNNTTVTVTTAGSSQMQAASIVLPNVAYKGFNSGTTSFGTSHALTPPTGVGAGITLAMFSGGDDTDAYALASPPASITAPHSANVTEGYAVSRLNASVGFEFAAKQHPGPAGAALTVTTSGTSQVRYFSLAFGAP